MLDRLFSFVQQVWEFLLFVEIVDEYQRGLVLRFGRFHRELEPGLHFYWPFRIEKVLSTSIVPDAAKLDEQTLTLRDGATVVIRPVITYRVHNIRKHLLEVEDAEGSLADAVSGAIRRELTQHPWSDLIEPDRCAEIEVAIAAGIRREAFRWGVEVIRVQFPDLVRLDGAFRLFGGRP